MTVPRPQPCDPIRDALIEFADAASALADAARRYLDSQKPQPEGRGSRIVRIVK